MPLLTVITIAKNNAAGLLTTYDSLSSQNFADFEMIVIPALSSDNTEVQANTLLSVDERVKVIPQNGFGIYEAMNLGLTHANGKYVCFLNSGDVYYDQYVLDKLVSKIEELKVGVVVGGYFVAESEKNKAYIYKSRFINPLLVSFSRKSACHQAMIFSTKVIEDVGLYDTKYRLASDLDLLIKVLQSRRGFRLGELIAIIEPNGIATKKIAEVYKEKHLIRKKHFSNLVSLMSMLWSLFAYAKLLYKTKFLNYFKF